MRAAAFMAAAALAAIPALAFAGTGSGQIACEIQVRDLNKQLQERAGQMDPGQVQSIRQRLDIASRQCPQGLSVPPAAALGNSAGAEWRAADGAGFRQRRTGAKGPMTGAVLCVVLGLYLVVHLSGE